MGHIVEGKYRTGKELAGQLFGGLRNGGLVAFNFDVFG